MEKKNKQRRPSRPVSELITLFDHQEAEKPKERQWRSANPLNWPKSPPMTHKRNSKGLSRFGNSNTSKSSETVLTADRGDDSLKDNKGTSGRQKLTAKPQNQTPKKPSEKTKKGKMDTKASKIDEFSKVPESLKREAKKQDESKKDNIDDGSDAEGCNRKKFPLDDSLAVLRREMHSLRKQDVELMSQLLALNSSIQEIKTSSSSSEMSNYSDSSDAETEIEINTPLRKAWHQRESSTGSDTSDFEPRIALLRPASKHGNRDSLGSEVSGYYSNPSPGGSFYGSNRSLNGYDVMGAESFTSCRSECCSPQPTSPVNPDPPFAHAHHLRNKTWLGQDYMGLAKIGSDPTLNRAHPDVDKLQSPVHSRAFRSGDERVRRMSLEQKRLHSRRNTACSLTSDISRSESDHSLSGYDVDSDSSRTMSSRLQKWQRSKSTCALNNAHAHRSPPIKNTIKVDLRNNPPTPGTAIELILPIQPLQPTRRSSAVRIAERKQVEKLNSLSKRQSTIW